MPSQKTETVTSNSTSGVFKFGAQQSQPTQAPTPAFGSGVFGGSSGGSFGSTFGNVPSTTPAFGATPPTMGSSDTNTSGAQAPVPAFGGKLLIDNIAI